MVLGPDIWEVLALVFLGLGLGAGVELGIMLGPGRFYIAKRARKENLESINAGEWDEAIGRIIQPIQDDVATLKELVEAEELQAQITLVHGRLEELDGALEARLDEIQIQPVVDKLQALDEALGTHLTAIHDGLDGLPARVRSSLEGARGAEMKEVYKGIEAAESTAIEMYEAEMSPEDRLAARIDQIQPPEEWAKKHEVGNLILTGVKEYVVDQIRARRGDVVNMRRVGGKKGRYTSVYGK